MAAALRAGEAGRARGWLQQGQPPSTHLQRIDPGTPPLHPTSPPRAPRVQRGDTLAADTRTRTDRWLWTLRVRARAPGCGSLFSPLARAHPRGLVPQESEPRRAPVVLGRVPAICAWLAREEGFFSQTCSLARSFSLALCGRGVAGPAAAYLVAPSVLPIFGVSTLQISTPTTTPLFTGVLLYRRRAGRISSSRVRCALACQGEVGDTRDFGAINMHRELKMLGA